MKSRCWAKVCLTIGAIVVFAGVVRADECVDPGGGGCHLTIQAAIDAASPGETINVAAATYVERLTIPKSVVLRGAQAGVDPTPGGARTNPLAESIVDFTSLPRLNPNVEIQINSGVSDVTIDGFTLIGHPNELVADESIVRVGGPGAPTDNDRIVIANNIMQGWKPILFKGGGSDTFTVASNRIVANKNGMVVQFGVDGITVSGNSFAAGAPLAGDPAAMQVAPINGGLIENNVVTGFTGGRAWGGSGQNSLEFRGNDFTGSRDGISIFGDSTGILIAENNISGNSRHGINIKAADVLIEANLILNNGDSGINIERHVNDSLNNVVVCNDISGNALFGLKVDAVNVPLVVAEDNWWGAADGPSGVGPGSGDAVSAGSDFDPFLSMPHWPTCPAPPTGACCTDGPGTISECIEVIQDECENGGGLFLGVGLTCADISNDCQPLSVEFDLLAAYETPGGVLIRWTTVAEIDTVGFRLLREEGGREKALTVIAPMFPASGNNLNGASYEFLDNTRRASAGVRYYVEDINIYGKATRHGPIEIVPMPQRESRSRVR